MKNSVDCSITSVARVISSSVMASSARMRAGCAAALLTLGAAGCAGVGGAQQSASSFHALSEVPPRNIAECVVPKWQARAQSVNVSPLGGDYIVRASNGSGTGITASIMPRGGGSRVRYTVESTAPVPDGYLNDLKLCL